VALDNRGLNYKLYIDIPHSHKNKAWELGVLTACWRVAELQRLQLLCGAGRGRRGPARQTAPAGTGGGSGCGRAGPAGCRDRLLGWRVEKLRLRDSGGDADLRLPARGETAAELREGEHRAVTAGGEQAARARVESSWAQGGGGGGRG
jgi:hypothetical protein